MYVYVRIRWYATSARYYAYAFASSASTNPQQMVRYAAVSLDLFNPVCGGPDAHYHGPRRHELENPQQEGGELTRGCTGPCLGDGPGDTLRKRTNESLRTRTACGGLLMRMWAARHASMPEVFDSRVSSVLEGGFAALLQEVISGMADMEHQVMVVCECA
jgi:hypothetical protein